MLLALLAMGSWLGLFVVSLDGYTPSFSKFSFLCLILSMLYGYVIVTSFDILGY